LRFKSSGYVLIAILMTVFALGGTSYGMWEETLGFFVLLVPLALALGFDRSLRRRSSSSARRGVIGSTVNPFSTGVASDAAGTSLGDGIGLRIALWVVVVARDRVRHLVRAPRQKDARSRSSASRRRTRRTHRRSSPTCRS
jgi:Predicted membrane protein